MQEQANLFPTSQKKRPWSVFSKDNPLCGKMERGLGNSARTDKTRHPKPDDGFVKRIELRNKIQSKTIFFPYRRGFRLQDPKPNVSHNVQIPGNL